MNPILSFEDWATRRGYIFIPPDNEGGGNYWSIPGAGEDGLPLAVTQEELFPQYEAILTELNGADSSGRPFFGTEPPFIPNFQASPVEGLVLQSPQSGEETFVSGGRQYTRIGNPDDFGSNKNPTNVPLAVLGIGLPSSGDVVDYLYTPLRPSIIYDPKYGYAVPSEPFNRITKQLQGEVVASNRNSNSFFGGSSALAALVPLAIATIASGGSIVPAAAKSAVGGAIQSVLRGQNPLQGALTGGALGGLSSGIGALTSGITGFPIVDQIIASGALGGVVSGVTGGNPLEGALSGAASAGIGNVAGSLAKDLTGVPVIDRTLGQAGASATLSAIRGGDPLQAALGSVANTGIKTVIGGVSNAVKNVFKNPYTGTSDEPRALIQTPDSYWSATAALPNVIDIPGMAVFDTVDEAVQSKEFAGPYTNVRIDEDGVVVATGPDGVDGYGLGIINPGTLEGERSKFKSRERIQVEAAEQAQQEQERQYAESQRLAQEQQAAAEAARIAGEQAAAQAAAAEASRIEAERQAAEARTAAERVAAEAAQRRAAEEAAAAEAARVAAEQQATEARNAAERAAAAEAQRVATEQARQAEDARIAAERESQRIAAEQEAARQVEVQRQAQAAAEEQARQAAEAQRQAAEGVRIAQEQEAARQAEAQRVAQETAPSGTADIVATGPTATIQAPPSEVAPVADSPGVLEGILAGLPGGIGTVAGIPATGQTGTGDSGVLNALPEIATGVGLPGVAAGQRAGAGNMAFFDDIFDFSDDADIFGNSPSFPRGAVDLTGFQQIDPFAPNNTPLTQIDPFINQNPANPVNPLFGGAPFQDPLQGTSASINGVPQINPLTGLPVGRFVNLANSGSGQTVPFVPGAGGSASGGSATNTNTININNAPPSDIFSLANLAKILGFGALAAGAANLGGGRSTTTATSTTPAPSAEELELIKLNAELARRQLASIDQLQPLQKQLLEASQNDLAQQQAISKALNAAITPEQQAALAQTEFERSKRLGPIQDQLLQQQLDIINTKGAATPEQLARTRAVADAAIEAGTGDINTQIKRGIGLISDEVANARGLRLTDTPIMREAALLTDRGNDQIASLVRNLRAAEAQANLTFPLAVNQQQSSMIQGQQTLNDAAKNFQDQLRQQANANRMAIIGQSSGTGIGLANTGNSGTALNALTSARLASGTRTQDKTEGLGLTGVGQLASGIGNLISATSRF